MKTQTAWAIKTPDDEIRLESISETEEEAWINCDTICDKSSGELLDEEKLKDQGYRCVEVEIREVDDEC